MNPRHHPIESFFPRRDNMKVKLVFVMVLGLLTIVLSTAPRAFAQVTTPRPDPRQTQTLLIRIETKIGVLKDEAQRITDRNPNAATPNQLGEYLSTLEQSVTRLHETFDNRGPITNDLRDVMSNATVIDQYVVRNRVTTSAQSQWRSLKTDFTSLATSNRMSWDWNRPVTPVDDPVEEASGTYTAPESQVRTLLSRIELKKNNLRTQMDTALSADTTADRSIADYMTGFETAERRLQQRFQSRQSTSADATEVLRRATYIDQFMTRNRLNPQTQAQWRNLKADLNTLATYYNVNWNWNQSLPTDTASSDGGGTPRNFDRRLTGTYRLNTSMSEDTAAAIDKALSSTPSAQRENYRRRLEQRLNSPETIAIEKNNATITMASSLQPRVTFQADGVARSETNDRGRTVTTTATADQDGLIINYQGERSSDFYLTFLPIADRRMKMTRRIYIDSGNNSVTVSSVYDKIDNAARWDDASSPVNPTGGGSSNVNESFVVPSGSRLNAELQSSITGSGSGEQFTMEVRTPTQYRGAIISGHVVTEDPARRVAGRSRVALVFDTIRLPSGQTHRFAGRVDSVNAVSGDTVTVTNQTAQTGTTKPKSGAAGILGSLIGAISGVPVDPAANSATTAGSILTQNRDTIDIGSGSQVAITATGTGTTTNPR